MDSNTMQANKQPQCTTQEKFVSNLSLKEMDCGKGFSSCVQSTKYLKDKAIVSVHLQLCTQDRDEGLFIVFNPKVTPWRRIWFSYPKHGY